MVQAERVCKNFGALKVLKGIALEVGAARCCAWSARPVRASRRFCAASTIWRQVNAGRLYVDGDLIGYARRADKLLRNAAA